jgi:hypothetical protein
MVRRRCKRLPEDSARSLRSSRAEGVEPWAVGCHTDRLRHSGVAYAAGALQIACLSSAWLLGACGARTGLDETQGAWTIGDAALDVTGGRKDATPDAKVGWCPLTPPESGTRCTPPDGPGWCVWPFEGIPGGPMACQCAPGCGTWTCETSGSLQRGDCLVACDFSSDLHDQVECVTGDRCCFCGDESHTTNVCGHC